LRHAATKRALVQAHARGRVARGPAVRRACVGRRRSFLGSRPRGRLHGCILGTSIARSRGVGRRDEPGPSIARTRRIGPRLGTRRRAVGRRQRRRVAFREVGRLASLKGGPATRTEQETHACEPHQQERELAPRASLPHADKLGFVVDLGLGAPSPGTPARVFDSHCSYSVARLSPAVQARPRRRCRPR
jgi:hypothetical protein